MENGLDFTPFNSMGNGGKSLFFLETFSYPDAIFHPKMNLFLDLSLFVAPMWIIGNPSKWHYSHLGKLMKRGWSSNIFQKMEEYQLKRKIKKFY